MKCSICKREITVKKDENYVTYYELLHFLYSGTFASYGICLKCMKKYYKEDKNKAKWTILDYIEFIIYEIKFRFGRLICLIKGCNQKGGSGGYNLPPEAYSYWCIRCYARFSNYEGDTRLNLIDKNESLLAMLLSNICCICENLQICNTLIKSDYYNWNYVWKWLKKL